MSQQKKACNLNDLISTNYQAKSYFMSLPDYVQGKIQQQTDSVHSMDELRRCAQSLLPSRQSTY